MAITSLQIADGLLLENRPGTDEHLECLNLMGFLNVLRNGLRLLVFHLLRFLLEYTAWGGQLKKL